MRWVRWINCLLLVVGSHNLSAQQLAIGNGDLEVGEFNFNPGFIARNDISEIRVEVFEKRSNQPIRSTGHEKVYRFTKDGNLAALSTFRNYSGRVDSVMEAFGLKGAAPNLKEYTRQDARGIFKEIYIKEGDTLMIERYRGSEKSPGSLTLQDIEYRVFGSKPTEEIQTLLNAEKLPYKRVTRQYDSNGYLVYKRENWLVSRKKKETHFTYNDKGKLAYKKEEQGDDDLQWAFEYGPFGNLKKTFYRINGTLQTKQEFLYNDDGLLDAVITKDEKTQNIRIERFSYARKDAE